MDVKTLYTLISVADHGSFAEAAAARGLSVSSVSIQMRALEEDVGLALFDRTRRPPVLTPEGRDFVERARDVIVSWEQLSESLKRSAESGLLKIGAVHTAVSGLLPSALIALRETAPELSIRLITGLTHELEAGVRGGRIDVAVVTEPDTLIPDAEFRVFCEERLVLIAHETARGESFREILEQNPYVRFSPMARVANQVEAKLRELGFTVTSQMEVDTLEGVISLVASGLGVSIVPERRGPIALPEAVKVYEFGAPAATRRLGLLTLKNNPRRRFADKLFDALLGEANLYSAAPASGNGN